MKKLYINTMIVSLNEYIDLERSHKMAAAEIKKSQTFKIAYLALQQKFTLEDGLYDVVFNWHKPNNRKDHDNIAFGKKFLLDGLVQAKILKTDSPKQIRNFKDTFTLDKTRPYVCCDVEFIKV